MTQRPSSASGDTVIARGRDPYFPPWPDVAQLNAFAPGLRQAAADTLLDIADQADGVRCDMAMLMLNDVFARPGANAPVPCRTQEYWTEVIDAVRAAHPDFVFAAEAYWDLEWDLQQLGFDYCYDKRLYDRLIHDGPDAIRGHLHADVDYQRRLVRFLENHDEPRAAAEFARRRRSARRPSSSPRCPVPPCGTRGSSRAGGCACRCSSAGGRQNPPTRSCDASTSSWSAAGASIRRGRWELCAASGWPDDSSYTQLLAWSWIDDEQRSLVVINYADAPAAALVHLPWDDLAGRTWRLDDRLSGQAFVRDGSAIATDGLYVQLGPWQFHVLAWTADDAATEG